MGKKGVSFEEKRTRILNLFYFNVKVMQKDVFNLKELESMGNKVGVISNTVKDVLQSLLDDNLVETDKIGAGNFFWALPSKGRQVRMAKLECLKSEVMSLKTKKKTLNQQIENQLKEKPDTAERLEKIKELHQTDAKIEEITKVRDSLKACTKSYYDECCQKLKEITNNCNKFTDDIFAARSFLQAKNPSFAVSDINKYFGIPDELDNI